MEAITCFSVIGSTKLNISHFNIVSLFSEKGCNSALQGGFACRPGIYSRPGRGIKLVFMQTG
jgi:hypothetical protein